MGITSSPAALIGVFITLIIGASLVAPLADIVVGGSGGNVTGAANAVYALLTLLFVIAVIMVAVKAIK